MLSECVRDQAAKQFAPPLLDEILVQLEAAPLPLLDGPRFQRDRDRVRLGVLKVAGSDPARFRKALDQASRDWRDLLVWAGMAQPDWERVLRDAGMNVPERP